MDRGRQETSGDGDGEVRRGGGGGRERRPERKSLAAVRHEPQNPKVPRSEWGLLSRGIHSSNETENHPDTVHPSVILQHPHRTFPSLKDLGSFFFCRFHSPKIQHLRTQAILI